MEPVTHLTAMGLELPSLSSIVGSLVFGIFGWAAFRRGRSKHDPLMLWGGLGLMVYPYAVSQPWLLWTTGLGLTGWLVSRWR